MTAENRALALQLARGNPANPVTAADAGIIVLAAEVFRRFLDGTTARIAVTAQVDGAAVSLRTPPGGTMPQVVNATVDNTTVTLVAAPEDDHNDPTGDSLAWANDDTAGVVADWVVSATAGVVADWVVSADTKTYTGTLKHVEGTVNIKVTDPAAPNVSPTDVQLVVGAGATSQIGVTATVA